MAEYADVLFALLPLALAAVPQQIVVVGDEVDPALLRQGAEAAGLSVVGAEDARAAFDAAGGCALVDVECLAKIALLADAGVVVTALPRDDAGGREVIAVDAGPRVGRARAVDDAGVIAAVGEALAALRQEASLPPRSTPPPTSSLTASDTPPSPAAALPTSPAAAPPVRTTAPPVAGGSMAWGALGGAGLSGAGVVAVVVGGVVAALGVDSATRAEAAHFQDESARIGAEANLRFWVAGAAGLLGLAAVGTGAYLIVEGGS